MKYRFSTKALNVIQGEEETTLLTRGEYFLPGDIISLEDMEHRITTVSGKDPQRLTVPKVSDLPRNVMIYHLRHDFQ
jgi:hypothetical protein